MVIVLGNPRFFSYRLKDYLGTAGAYYGVCVVLVAGGLSLVRLTGRKWVAGLLALIFMVAFVNALAAVPLALSFLATFSIAGALPDVSRRVVVDQALLASGGLLVVGGYVFLDFVFLRGIYSPDPEFDALVVVATPLFLLFGILVGRAVTGVARPAAECG